MKVLVPVCACLAWILDGIAVQFGDNILFDYRAKRLYVIGHSMRVVNLVCLLCVLYALIACQSLDVALSCMSVVFVVILYLTSGYPCVLFIGTLCEIQQNNTELEIECGVHRDVEMSMSDYIKLGVRSLQALCWLCLLVRAVI